MLNPNIPTFTVSELNLQVKTMLENTFMTVYVTGEVSNLSKPSSGHCYFTLKDKQSQLRCAFFKSYQRLGENTLKEGEAVTVMGKLSLFEARGDYQLIAYHLETKGAGLLYQQFEALKNKLSAEGLFDPKFKKPFPRFPHTIGIITSPQGAALRDILITLYRRYPISDVIVYPSEVQGQTAAAQLSTAIQLACEEQRADVLLLARGGGSAEDLWSFNDETLIRTIFHANIPLVCGVGHETDFTLADFVADLRAATPTAAAAAITPDLHALHQQLQQSETQLIYCLTQCFYYQRQALGHLQAKIKQAVPKLTYHMQTLDYLERQLSTNMSRVYTFAEQQLALQIQTLQHLSPLQTLNRGYAIATQNGAVLMDSSTVQGDIPIEVLLAKGRLICKASSQIT